MGVKVRERPKGSGTFWVFIDHQGRRKAKKIGPDRKLAVEVARKIEARLVLGDVGLAKPQEDRGMTFETYATLWLEDYVKAVRRESTYQRYRQVLTRYVFPIIGKTPIAQVKRVDIRNLILHHHKNGLGRASLCIIRDVISGTFNHAVDDELVEVNPASGIIRRLQLDRERNPPVEPLTADEVAAFLDTCQAHFPDFHPVFLCAFRTGMRMGELLALRWGDVDWHGQFIRVNKAYKRGRVDKTKTGKARRVDMSDHLTAVLRQHHATEKRRGLSQGHGGAPDVIFHRDGGHMEQNYIRRVFKRILAKAGLREIRFHDMRHTFASLLLTNGESPVYVKEQLGHSNISTTVDIYGHLIPSANRDAVNRLDTQASATYPQPPETEMPQPIEIAACS